MKVTKIIKTMKAMKIIMVMKVMWFVKIRKAMKGKRTLQTASSRFELHHA